MWLFGAWTKQCFNQTRRLRTETVRIGETKRITQIDRSAAIRSLDTFIRGINVHVMQLLRFSSPFRRAVTLRLLSASILHITDATRTGETSRFFPRRGQPYYFLCNKRPGLLHYMSASLDRRRLGHIAPREAKFTMRFLGGLFEF